MCSSLFPPEAIALIVGQAQVRNPLYVQGQELDAVKISLGILVDTFTTHSGPPQRSFTVGSLCPRMVMEDVIPFIVDSRGISTSPTSSCMTVEMATFPYLFPNGRGWMPSGMDLNKYLSGGAHAYFQHSLYVVCTA